MYEILMGSWLAGQVKTIKNSVMHKSKLRMKGMILMRVLMILCEIFLRAHLKNIVIIYLLVSDRVRNDGLGDSL